MRKVQHADLDAASTPAAARAAFRAGQVRPTCGVAQGYAQANLMILPKEQAFDFLLFAQRNPKPCPLLEVMEPGVTEPATAPEADIRTDVPMYRVWSVVSWWLKCRTSATIGGPIW